ncbi:MAG: hypothetical protein M1826_000066 [Phylliscum demangeonii]|nr:MAG: hypothetical protein M1826_000066 [Phylliscum demangeonii]
MDRPLVQQSARLVHGRAADLTSPDGASAVRSIGSSSSGVLTPLVRLMRDPLQTLHHYSEAWWDGLSAEERARIKAVEERTRSLSHALKDALTYDEWRTAAEELDVIEGHDRWKALRPSPDYDVDLVEARTRQLDEARASGDVDRMLFLIRTSLARGLGEMGNVRLYRRSHVGTKRVIERYISTALETLNALLARSAQASYNAMDTKYMLEQVLSARQAFGRSAMLLSGGATFGMNHIGVLKALWEARLLPRIISGASAGSIVAAVLCTHTDDEVPALLESFPYGDMSIFAVDGEEDGIVRRLTRLLKEGALMDIKHLMRVMRDLMGDLTFQEAYNRTRRILNICVSSASVYELPRLLNYVTAPNVLIWSAVAASCSVPLLFTAATILAKHPKTGDAVPWNPAPHRYIDGSVDNDLPMTRLAEMFNVNHFIVSQVNPHVIPFLARDDEIGGVAAAAAGARPSGWMYGFMQLAKAEVLHRMHVCAELGIFPNAMTKARSVLSQKYSGHITIFPAIAYTDFPRMLQNPTTEFVLQAMLAGERAAWPRLSRIRNHCALELALDDAVQKLRARVVFSPSQVDLRRGTVRGPWPMPADGPVRAESISAAATADRRTRRRAHTHGHGHGHRPTRSAVPKEHAEHGRPPSLGVAMPPAPRSVTSTTTATTTLELLDYSSSSSSTCTPTPTPTPPVGEAPDPHHHLEDDEGDDDDDDYSSEDEWSPSRPSSSPAASPYHPGDGSPTAADAAAAAAATAFVPRISPPGAHDATKISPHASQPRSARRGHSYTRN